MNKKILVSLFIILLISGLIGGVALAGEDLQIERFYGSTRIETAIEISKAGWDKADTVILARSDDFPDAMAGSPLAFSKDAPILLTLPDRLPSEVLEEMSRLGAEDVIILGGTRAISSSIETDLKKMDINTERIGGANRFETAKLIADKLPHYDKAIITYGNNFPDALAIGPYAAQKGYPILLTETNSIPKDTAEALGSVTSSIVVGGEFVISSQVKNNLPSPVRIAGTDRYDTAVRIMDRLGFTADLIYIATGTDFADALTGSVLAAKENAPMLMVRNDSIPSLVAGVITEETKKVVILGGKNAIYSAVENDLGGLSPGKTVESNPESGLLLLEEDEKIMLQLINEERTNRGLAPLKVHEGLREVARIKSKEMIELEYFSHYSPVYGSPFDMIRHFGYEFSTAGENLAINLSVENAHRSLMNSTGHKRNILNESFTHVGIGAYQGIWGKYYTQMFFTPR